MKLLILLTLLCATVTVFAEHVKQHAEIDNHPNDLELNEEEEISSNELENVDDDDNERKDPSAKAWGSRRRFFSRRRFTSSWRRRSVVFTRRRSISTWRRRYTTGTWRRRTVVFARRRWVNKAKKLGAGILVAAGGIKKIRNKIIKELIKPKCMGCAGLCERPDPKRCRCITDYKCLKGKRDAYKRGIKKFHHRTINRKKDQSTATKSDEKKQKLVALINRDDVTAPVHVQDKPVHAKKKNDDKKTVDHKKDTEIDDDDDNDDTLNDELLIGDENADESVREAAAPSDEDANNEEDDDNEDEDELSWEDILQEE